MLNFILICVSLNSSEVQQNYTRLQSEMQNIAGKIGELEQEAEEHVCVAQYLYSACV